MRKILIISPLFEQWLPLIRLLRRLSYSVYIKPCSNRGLFTLQSMSFDLILVEDELADMHGLKLISRIHSLKVRKKIIFFSKNYRLEEKIETESLGINQYITQSIGWVDTVILVHRAMGDRNELCLN